MTFPTAGEYSEDKIKACHSILIELVHILGDFVEDMAIIGGWVPTLLIPNAEEEHIGSMDVDHWGPTAVADFQEIDDEEERERIKRRAYESAQALLLKTGHTGS